ncbi:hypothetical protein [Helicobacter pametensis]|uniref:hypothetical protein n=1 Tax=Helicobacter pametensis TaxID=95149 RepID=UPI0004BB0F0E|nr:hypothetical protein [Helicobacter pametensis]
MREVEAWCYIDAVEEIKRLEKESLEVREYLRNLRLLKTIDSQSLKTLEEVASEENFQEILKIAGKTMKEERQISFYPSATKKNFKERREIIVLTSPIIEEFDRVASNGTSSMEKGANLWDYRGEEVMIELKYSVVRLISLEGRMLFTVSGRPNFVEKIGQLTSIDEGDCALLKSVNNLEDDDIEIQKVMRRISKWFVKIHQKNSKILLAYLEVSKLNSLPIQPSSLERACGLDRSAFYSCFSNMKSAHSTIGKIFQTNPDGTIELWQPVADFIIQEYKKVFG